MNRAISSKEDLESIKSIQGAIPSYADLLFKRYQLRHRATYFHSLRVAGHCRRLARALDLSAEEEAKLIVSAALHEVGVMETASEYEIPFFSMQIVEQWGLAEAVDRAAIEQQGENMDGTGFPHGLIWRDISLSAKIIRVADSFDRMTVSPLGSPLLSSAAALDELYRWSDVLFDGVVVDGLKCVLDGKVRVRTLFR